MSSYTYSRIRLSNSAIVTIFITPFVVFGAFLACKRGKYIWQHVLAYSNCCFRKARKIERDVEFADVAPQLKRFTWEGAKEPVDVLGIEHARPAPVVLALKTKPHVHKSFMDKVAEREARIGVARVDVAIPLKAKQFVRGDDNEDLYDISLGR